ncbi:MAG: response regulator, partial [Saprospiraceae bacterium]|nr:response regulator [Saprospiraceae bacterium]
MLNNDEEIRVLILEDEPLSRELVEHYIKSFCNKCIVVGVASDADEAYTIIDEHRPNLLLLDIEIANGRSTENTFDLLARL